MPPCHPEKRPVLLELTVRGGGVKSKSSSSLQDEKLDMSQEVIKAVTKRAVWGDMTA